MSLLMRISVKAQIQPTTVVLPLQIPENVENHFRPPHQSAFSDHERGQPSQLVVGQ